VTNSANSERRTLPLLVRVMHAYSTQYEANLLLEERWQKHLRQGNAERRKAVRARLDNCSPFLPKHVRANLKGKQQKEDWNYIVERDNATLLKKMKKILETPQSVDPRAKVPEFKSLNSESRKRELARVTKENQRLLKQIEVCSPTYSHKKWEKERKTVDYYLRQICRYPVRPVPAKVPWLPEPYEEQELIKDKAEATPRGEPTPRAEPTPRPDPPYCRPTSSSSHRTMAPTHAKQRPQATPYCGRPSPPAGLKPHAPTGPSARQTRPSTARTSRDHLAAPPLSRRPVSAPRQRMQSSDPVDQIAVSDGVNPSQTDGPSGMNTAQPSEPLRTTITAPSPNAYDVAAAAAAIGCMSQRSFAELASYKLPPHCIARVLEAIIIALQVKVPAGGEVWPTAQQLLLDKPALMKRLGAFDLRMFHRAHGPAKLRRFIEDPDFTPRNLGRVSAAAAALCSWSVVVATSHPPPRPRSARPGGRPGDLKRSGSELSVEAAALLELENQERAGDHGDHGDEGDHGDHGDRGDRGNQAPTDTGDRPAVTTRIEATRVNVRDDQDRDCDEDNDVDGDEDIIYEDVDD